MDKHASKNWKLKSYAYGLILVGSLAGSALFTEGAFAAQPVPCTTPPPPCDSNECQLNKSFTKTPCNSCVKCGTPNALNCIDAGKCSALLRK